MSAPVVITRRALVVATTVVVGIVLAVGVVITTTVSASTAATQEADYRACVEARGISVASAQACMETVYGSER